MFIFLIVLVIGTTVVGLYKGDIIAASVPAFVIAGHVGYIANVFKFFIALIDGVTEAFILRALGIIWIPLGCILGYF